jgi:hypothetical protein
MGPPQARLLYRQVGREVGTFAVEDERGFCDLAPVGGCERDGGFERTVRSEPLDFDAHGDRGALAC